MAAAKPKKPKNKFTRESPIVVAVDFSDDSWAALVWACDAAPRLGAPILVLHVVHDPAEAPGYYRGDKNDLLRPMEVVAEKMMRKFLKKIHEPGVPKRPLKNMKTRLVKGLPATRIIEVAEKVNARMIVMGSRGHTGLSHLLLGSKTERVVQLSSIPVVVVKGKKR